MILFRIFSQKSKKYTSKYLTSINFPILHPTCRGLIVDIIDCQSIDQRRHFTPFVVSTDGMFGFEARAFLKRLAKLLAEEWEKPYPVVMGFINARMSIALVRATNRCIRGSRTPASNMSNRFRWEGGAGLGLLKSDN